jgi:hypothetical protein
MCLLQVAILMSYWCPFNVEDEISNYWIDQAYYHASKTSLLADIQDFGSQAKSECHGRLIWSCLLVRDRITSFTLKRPYRLQASTALNISPSSSDFGTILAPQTFGTAYTKALEINLFLSLSHLSEILADIMELQLGQSTNNNASFMAKADFDKISLINGKLREWERVYWLVNFQAISQLATWRSGSGFFITLMLLE